ncbi:MAG: ATP-binding protein [Paludibacteraceae bacterium]|nr:ATP-binding protein [Paludibacteraceae bacterium]
MIEFIALTNFFSFKNRTEFSLKATKEKPRGMFSGEDWWTEVDGIKLLKTAFLLGNNGSGKTNFLNGLSVLNELVTVNRNSKTSSRYRLPNVSFLLSEETKNAPSAIEVAFHTAGYRYTYYISWKQDYIVEEHLLRQEGKKKEKLIFTREFSKEKDIVVVSYPQSTTIPTPVQELINQNILKYSSVISIYDNKNFECEDIRNVYNYFRYVDLWNVKKYELATMLAKRSNEKLLKPIILSILKDMGSTIYDYKVDTLTFDIADDEREFLLTRMSEEEYRANFPSDKRTVQKLQFGYKVVEKEETVWLPENLESEGTLEAIRLIIVLFDSIWRRTPIAIDECAQSIHPKALEFILSFFLKSSDTAQIFIATQALALLKWENLRRDTLRFFEKDKTTGCSSFTTINNRTLHRNNQIYDLYMNKTFGGEVNIMEKEPWIKTLSKISQCMINRCWEE